MVKSVVVYFLFLVNALTAFAQAEFRVLHDFSGPDGQIGGKLLTISDGRIYGMTRSGGELSHGTAFSMNLDGSEFITLHDFDYAAEGGHPRGGPILVGSKLYGLTWGAQR